MWEKEGELDKNISENKDGKIDDVTENEGNKVEEVYGIGDPIYDDFWEMVIKIFVRFLLIKFILVIIGAIIKGEFKINMIPFTITYGSIYVLVNLLTFPRFQKNSLWIKIWMGILAFISIFTYPH